MRRRARWRLSAGGSTNTVSERLNSRAIACMAALSSPSGSSTTASGLPAKRRSVNTSSVTKRRRMAVSVSRGASARVFQRVTAKSNERCEWHRSERLGFEDPAQARELVLRVGEQDFGGSGFEDRKSVGE